jgi:hypothetical protein
MNATKGAMKAAEIIMGDKHRIRTDYGEKTIYGLADLIDRETAAPELLEACKWLLFHAENGRRWKTVAHRGLDFTDDEFEGRLRAAISKAEGGA